MRYDREQPGAYQCRRYKQQQAHIYPSRIEIPPGGGESARQHTSYQAQIKHRGIGVNFDSTPTE